MKTFRKSVSIWRSCGQKYSGAFFRGTLYIPSPGIFLGQIVSNEIIRGAHSSVSDILARYTAGVLSVHTIRTGLLCRHSTRCRLLCHDLDSGAELFGYDLASYRNSSISWIVSDVKDRVEITMESPLMGRQRQACTLKSAMSTNVDMWRDHFDVVFKLHRNYIQTMIRTR